MEATVVQGMDEIAGQSIEQANLKRNPRDGISLSTYQADITISVIFFHDSVRIRADSIWLEIEKV